MAVTSKLVVYNEALRELAAAPLANLTTANRSKQVLDGAFDHAVEYVLAKRDWNFARRRAALASVVDATYPPYTRRYTKPTDYLRKVWLKRLADDEFQVEHAEVASVIYGNEAAPLLEYMSDTAANYDPENWPPHFTRMLSVYLALLAAPALARAGDDVEKSLYARLDAAESLAGEAEAVFTFGEAIPTDRLPVMRRAIEIMGQALGTGLAAHSEQDKLRWHLNKAWAHAVRHCLEQGAWNFATRRALLSDGAPANSVVPSSSAGGIDEGYSVAPASTTTTDTDIIGYTYGYPLPDDFLHKVWIKGSVSNDTECPHQRLGDYIFCDFDPAVMEYVAEDATSVLPASWPATFHELVAARLAWTAAPELVVEDGGRGKTIKATQVRDRVQPVYLRALADARNKDAIQQEPYQLPSGSFVRARMGGGGWPRLSRGGR